MRGKIKRCIAGMLAVSLVTLLASPVGSIFGRRIEAAGFKDLNQQQMVQAMGAGWNLGNQMEAIDGSTNLPEETGWGNPRVTETFIKAVKAAGFSTIRIPVSWLGHIDSRNTISKVWLDRVQEVVDMCVNNGLYTIINVHGDGYYSMRGQGAWLLCAEPDQERIRTKFSNVWWQIADCFKEYDEHLIFEAMNEEFNGIYGTPDRTAYENINQYNQIFVDTVRSTGGNNAKRWLMIAGWNTDINYTVGDYGFLLPMDEKLDASIKSAGQKRLMISVHDYEPWYFCGPTDETGGNSKTQWGNQASDESKKADFGGPDYMAESFAKLQERFVSNGYPVVIGEYGAADKSSYDSANLSSRLEYINTLCSHAKKTGVVPVLWDNGVNGKDGFGVFNRQTCQQTQPELIRAIVSVYQDAGSAVEEQTRLLRLENGRFEEDNADNLSWFIEASDTDKIAVTYRYKDDTKVQTGYNLMLWSATEKEGTWRQAEVTQNLEYAAPASAWTTATKVLTVGEIKEGLEIKNSQDISYLKLEPINSGEIVEFAYISPLPVIGGAEEERTLAANLGSNVSYEPKVFTWFSDANETDRIILKYNCTDNEHCGWGIMQWEAEVDGNVKKGTTILAPGTAGKEITVSYRIGELRKSLGVTESSRVTDLALKVFNEGRICSLSYVAKKNSAIQPDVTPSATPEITPVATPETTPVATPETTPVATPEITPIATPIVTPDLNTNRITKKAKFEKANYIIYSTEKTRFKIVNLGKKTVKKWLSSKKKIATVRKNGVVCGKKIGKVKITAVLSDNTKISCTVRIKKPKVTLRKNKGVVKVNKYSKALRIKKKIKTDRILRYKVSSRKIIRVNRRGVIRGIRRGRAKVIVLMKSGAKVSYTVVVR